MDIEAKIAALEAKIDMLFSAIMSVDKEGRYSDFREKWEPQVKEIELDQKTLYGDDWDELSGIWDFVEKNRDSEGFDEEKVVTGYLNSVKDKFKKLKGVVEETKEIIEEANISETEKQVAENHLQIAEDAIETAEDAVESAGEEIDVSDDAGIASALKDHPAFRAGAYSV